MRLAFVEDFRLALVVGDRVYPIPGARGARDPYRAQERMARLIAEFPRRRSQLEAHIRRAQADPGRTTPVEKARLRAPLPRPGKLICAAVNYLEFGQLPPAEQDCFLKAPTTVIGPGETIVLPDAQATIFHHEAELAVVIGKRASKVPPEKAMEHVFGYTCFMDISARGLNPNGRLSFFLGKCWDTFGPMGPWIVTADEVPDPHNLQVRLWVDDQLRHDYNTSDMAHKIPQLIAFASRVCTLEPGDVIACGTNHQGIGPVQDGETVTMEIERIGRFSVKVRDPLKRSWPKGIDTEFARRVIASARR
jgi:2-keto-4-pentenoate hydratase/2-oxohepta-3-ene-1,7-dioic acid hydratase in catechol pathway